MAFSDSTKAEIRSEPGPESRDFEFDGLHPKTFVRKHVLNGDGLALDEIRSALDPRAELTQVADAVREATDEGPRETVPPEHVPLTKDTQTGSSAHPAAFAPDATWRRPSHGGEDRRDRTGDGGARRRPR